MNEKKRMRSSKKLINWLPVETAEIPEYVDNYGME